MKDILKYIIPTVFFVMMATSCATSNRGAADGYWQLITINGVDADRWFANKRPTLKLNYQANAIMGEVGCNNYYGRFQIKDEKFRASDAGSSMMICQSRDKEQEFINTLFGESLSLQYNQFGNLIFVQNGKTVLEFQKASEPLENIWK